MVSVWPLAELLDVVAGGVPSTLIPDRVAEPVFPALSFGVPLALWFAPSVSVVLDGQVARPELASKQVQAVLTDPLYQEPVVETLTAATTGPEAPLLSRLVKLSVVLLPLAVNGTVSYSQFDDPAEWLASTRKVCVVPPAT